MKDFNETLKSIIVEKIAFACYVPKGSGAPKHKNRPFHGFVIAGEDFCHTYTFSDGKSIYVKPNDLFYLPKNSNYKIKKNPLQRAIFMNLISHLFHYSQTTWKTRTGICTKFAYF